MPTSGAKSAQTQRSESNSKTQVASAVSQSAPAAALGTAGLLGQQVGNRAMQALLLLAASSNPEQHADQMAEYALRGASATSRGAERRRAARTRTMLPLDTPEHVRTAVSAGSESLNDGLSQQMGDAFGFDFRHVRIHRGEQAARSAELLAAQAYAVGPHVVFGRGQYAPQSASGRALLAHELAHVVQQHDGAPRLQLKKAAPAAPKVQFVEVMAEGFDESATTFVAMLAAQAPGKFAKFRIVIANGPNVKVYDETGKPVVKKYFHLNRPVALPIGVFGRMSRTSAQLHALAVQPNGKWYDAGAVQMEQAIDFGKDIDAQAEFTKALQDGLLPVFYISPRSTAVPPEADAPPPVPIENLPEFMEFQAKTKANLPAWPSATLPLTPQLATVNSTATFICRVDKNQGVNTLDRVTNLMQATRFRWEVLKLDERLHVTEKKSTTGWDAAAEGFRRRQRQLDDDRQAMLGNRKRQSIPESVFREAMVAQTQGARAALAMVGQTVLTVINAITGGPNQLTTEDVMDVPLREQGDYFVRCLATQVVPDGAKFRRATSVSGAMVSVYNIEDVARDALVSGQELAESATTSKAGVETRIKKLENEIAKGEGDVRIKQVELEFVKLRLGYFDDLARAGANPHDAKVAEQNLLAAELVFIETNAVLADTKYADWKAKLREDTKKKLDQVNKIVARMRGALKEWDSQIEPVSYMRGVLVDEVTSARADLAFSVGERKYVAANKLEVVIADVTGAKGRTFNGSGSGFLGAGRQDAWLDALTDLRRNLNRGRGWLSYEVPKQYEQWKSELPNPMKLEMSASAQVKEMVDDAAHALTIVAILAAPFTAGASLSILAVLAPIQAASSLYNIVNRSAYGDLELDQESVFDLINIATLGLGKVSTMSKAGSRTMQMVASGSKIALKLIAGGQFIVVSFETFQALMATETNPNADPREIRRKKLKALLNWFEQAAIPITEKIYAEAHGPGARPDKTAGGKDSAAAFETPVDVRGKPKPKVSVQEGVPLEPAKKTPVEKPAEARKPGADDGAVAGTEGKRATSGDVAPAVFKPTKTQLRGVPESLHGKVAVVEGMGGDARVVYKKQNGLITDVQIQIGERATAADVKTHAAVAELMLKYSGVGGRIRKLLNTFVDIFAGKSNHRAEVGSRAWEAKLELTKLDRMMAERHAELEAIADQPAEKRDAKRQKELTSELDSLETQFREHAEVFNAIEMRTAEGRGYVAAEGLAQGESVRKERKLPPAPDGYRWRFRKGTLEVIADPGMKKRVYDPKTREFPVDKGAREPERFDSATDKREAFRELGGYDKKTTFGAFVELLLKEGVIERRQEVIDAMGEPAGRTHDTVRGNVKEGFKTQLIEKITKPSYLKKTARYREVLKATSDARQAERAAGIDELARISDKLPAEERGAFGERVYDTLFGTRGAATHVDISAAELAKAKGVRESAVEQGREIDRMDGTRGREIKNVTTRLGPRERGQIDDMLAMVGRKVQPRTGPPRVLETLSVAFLNADGGAANAKLAFEVLSANPKAPLTFEFHARDGKVIKVTSKNMNILKEPDFRAKLGLPDD